MYYWLCADASRQHWNLFVNTFTTMHYKDQISGDKGSVCHCNSTLYENHLKTFSRRARNLRTEAVARKRVYCVWIVSCTTTLLLKRLLLHMLQHDTVCRWNQLYATWHTVWCSFWHTQQHLSMECNAWFVVTTSSIDAHSYMKNGCWPSSITPEAFVLRSSLTSKQLRGLLGFSRHSLCMQSTDAELLHTAGWKSPSRLYTQVNTTERAKMT